MKIIPDTEELLMTLYIIIIPKTAKRRHTSLWSYVVKAESLVTQSGCSAEKWVSREKTERKQTTLYSN